MDRLLPLLHLGISDKGALRLSHRFVVLLLFLFDEQG